MTYVFRHAMTAAFLLLFLVSLPTAGNGQTQEKLVSKEWKTFKKSITEFDGMMLELQRIQQENPGIENDMKKLQEAMGENLQRFIELTQTIPQQLPPDLASITTFDEYGIDELRMLKYAMNIARHHEQSLDINLALIAMISDADSIRSLSAEAAQFAVFANRLELAEDMIKDGVLDSVEHAQRAMLLNSISTAYHEQGRFEHAREFAVQSMRATGEAIREAGASDGGGQQGMQVQMMLAQQGGMLATTLLYHLKESGDAAGLDALNRDLKAALDDESTWEYIESMISDRMAQIEKERAALNKAATELKEHLWIGSEPLSLAGLKGKVVLLDFFATWCRPCIMAFPYLKEWHEKYEDAGLVVIGLTNYQGRYDGASLKQEEEFAKLRDDFIPKHKINWPIGVEKDGRQTMTDYDVQGIPHVTLIDRQGKVRYVKVGAADYDKTEKKIQELLAE
jgi:thiol-disulfide isomerase/thioredoxin